MNGAVGRRDQAAAVDALITQGRIDEISLASLEEQAEFARLKQLLGKGEAA